MVNFPRKQKHFTIPLFIPHEACPFQCIFCNQRTITGKNQPQSQNEIIATIKRNLATLPEGAIIEAGFFGGTFTGLSFDDQKKYLDLVVPFVLEGKIASIRLSTRPDFIDEERLNFLSQYPVKMIELGVQSFDDEVLRLSCRGHNAADSVRASEMIRYAGFDTGLQMMVGLPGDSPEKVRYTAKEIVRLEATETRIYPVLVIKGTYLEKMFREGRYSPLSLEQAVEWTVAAAEVFEDSPVRIIRMGLHQSDALTENGYVAGPVHPSFSELVMTEIWKRRLSSLEGSGGNLHIRVNPEELNNAVGYKGKNRDMLSEKGFHVKFIADESIPLKSFHADHS